MPTTKQRTQRLGNHAPAAKPPKRWPARVGVVRLSDGETSSDGAHRSWVMFFPVGHFEHEQYGELNFTRARLATIKRQFDERVRHIDIALDANHDQDKATGWVEQLQLREAGADPKTGQPVPAGLWGLVRWTPLGLRYLKDQIYRYFSPEFGPWKDPETGKQYRDVLIGGGLTNRPFLKRMTAVQLAEISARPWSSIKKSCLPRSCFLVQGDAGDKSTWKLPIYEGAGPKDADGCYTKRGALNINAVRAALAAIGGARTGSPMSVSGDIKTKLQRLLGRYDGSGKDSGSAQANERMARENGMARKREGAKPAQKTAGTAAGNVGKTRREREQDLEALLFHDDDVDPLDDDLDGDDDDAEEGESGELSDSNEGMTFAAKKSAKTGKGAAADDAEDAADDGADEGDEQYDDTSDMDSDYSMDDDEEEDTPTEGTSGRASSKRTGGHSTKTMSKKANERGAGGMSLAEMQEELLLLREESARSKYLLYEAAVDKTLEGWAKGQVITLGENGKASRDLRGRVALSKTFRDAYRFFMLKEGITLTERHRGGIRKLVELALTSAVVDLSTRGSSFDQESRRTLRDANDLRRRGPGSADQSTALQEHAVRLAESRFNKKLEQLSDEEKFAVFNEAAEAVDYR